MSLIKNTSFYTIGLILPKIGAFVFLPIYLKYLSPSEYGIISSLLVFNSILAVLFTLSMPRALYRIYYDYEEDNEKKALLGTITISVLVIAVISSILLFVFKNQVQLIYRSIPFYPFFVLAIAAVFFQSLKTVHMTLLQIQERAALFVTLAVSSFFFSNILKLILIIKYEQGVIGYFLADITTAILFIPVYYIIVYKEICFCWNKKIFINTLIFSLPIIPNILSAWILNLSDRVFIERYFSTTDVGIYSLGYQIAGLMLVFAGAFKKAYDPFFYKTANSNNKTEAKSKLYKTNYIYMLVLILATFLISFFAKEGVVLFFNSKYYAAINVIPIVSLAYLISQNSGVLNVMMYQEKKTKTVMWITIISAGLNILLNFLLIPKMGIYGAAWATVISFLLVFILSYRLAKKAFFIPYNWKQIIPVLLFFLGVYILFRIFEINNIYVSLVVKSLVVSAISFAFYIKYKVQILSIIKTKK